MTDNSAHSQVRLSLGDRVTLDLTTMTPNGDVIGRHEGMVVFVPYGLPGERVEVQITHVRRNFARARIVSQLTVSPNRVAAPCSVFGRCGGCQWQHVAYPAQLAFKTDIVREQLAGIGKLDAPNVRPCVASPQNYEYRNRMQFSVSERGRPGFHAPGTRDIHDVIEIDDCHISHPEIRQALRAMAASGERDVVHQIDMRVSDRDVEGGSVIKVGEYEYFISPESFFQINVGVAGLIMDHVLAELDLRGDETVLDLYCGVGLFTLPLATRAGRVYGVENNRGAIEDAHRNALQVPADRRPVFVRRDVLKAVDREPMVSERFDVVVVDPPRSGVFPEVLAKLISLRPRTIVYVSCEPSTLARDLRILSDGGYRLASAQPFDMFPQTHHVETVAVLGLR